MSDPIRLFIGSSSNGEDARIEAVYEYSLRKHLAADRNLEITWMRQTRDISSPWGGWQTTRWSTPFSGFRWAIPEVCNFEGKAIYTDCDMINLRNIGDLIDVDMEGKLVAARQGHRFGGHEFCVMVFDCEKFQEYSMPIGRMKTIPIHHLRMIRQFSGNSNLVCNLDPKWNCLDGEDYSLDEIYQLHFTNMATQPWQPAWYTGTPCEHPRTDVVEFFEAYEEEAKKNGYNFNTYIPTETFGEYDIIGQ